MLKLRRSQVISFIEVGTLDVLEKADVVRGRLAKYGKKLDESAFNNQVQFSYFAVMIADDVSFSVSEIIAKQLQLKYNENLNVRDVKLPSVRCRASECNYF